MFTIISYDIVHDRRRTNVMRLLKGYGTRVQYSVFECMLNQSELLRLKLQIQQIIDPHTDSVRYYRLDADTVQRITIHGIGHVTTEPSHWLV